jgi:hypothetical protein
MDRTGDMLSDLHVLWVDQGRLTLDLLRRHLSHAALTLVGSCRVAEVLDIDKDCHCRLRLRCREGWHLDAACPLFTLVNELMTKEESSVPNQIPK